VELDFPPPEQETAIVEHESGVDRATAHEIVTLAERIRALRDRGLSEVPSTRLLVAAGALVTRGVPVRDACRAAIVAPWAGGGARAALCAPVPGDGALGGALRDLVDARFVWRGRAGPMSEREELITDAARHATVFARNLWRRHRGRGRDERRLGLVDVAPR